jgi:AraC-like DNA-binding protein
LFFQWKLLIDFNKWGNQNRFVNQTNAVLKWLKVFSWANSGILFSFIVIVLYVIAAPHINTALDFIPSFPSIFYAAMLFIVSSYLITHPEVFEGLPYIKRTIPPMDLVANNEAMTIATDFEKEIGLIEQYFENEAPFLKQNISINDVSVALGIPARSLSFLLNAHFQQRFTDYVNTHRILFVNQKIKSGYLNKFTIESLAQLAGFSSKSTFHAAFKKVNQCTPKEFEKKLGN